MSDSTRQSDENGSATITGHDKMVARLNKIPMLLGLGGVAVSLLVSYLVFESMQDSRHGEMRSRMVDLLSRVQIESNVPVSSLRGLRALFKTGENINKETFSKFSRSLRAEEAGTTGYGWAPGVVNEARGDAFPVRLIEPDSLRRHLENVDLMAIEGIEDALNASIELDEIRITPPLSDYLPDIGKASVLAILPHYKRDAETSLINDRRANVDGILFVIYDIAGVVARAVRESSVDESIRQDTLALRIERAVGSRGKSILFETDNFKSIATPKAVGPFSLGHISVETFEVARLPLRVTTVVNVGVSDGRGFVVPGLILAAGSAMFLILAVFTHLLISREQGVKTLVVARTKAFEESQKRMEDMANVSADWFWETDADQYFTHLSERFEEVSGHSPSLYLGRKRQAAAAIDEENPDANWRRHFDDLANRRAFRDFRYRLHRAEGYDKYFSVSGRPVFDEDGTFKGYRGSGRDVTTEEMARRRLRESEERLQRYVEELEVSRQYLEENTQEIAEMAERYAIEKERAEASEKSKSEFLASMSHEIRTPMTGVMGFADMLLDGKLDPADREKVIKIKAATQSLLTIINDILDLSKLDAGRLQVESIDFNLRRNIDDAIDLVGERARQKSLYLRSEYDDLPDGINGDPTRVRQILINLVGNAVKFTNTGGITVRAAKIESGGDEMIHVSVKDTGIGIPDENQRLLFEDFSQADASVSRHYEGTGLGLSISRRLSELMGGGIGVESTVGEGSEFWFEIPYRPATSDVSKEASQQLPQTFVSSRSLNILVAEDNRLNQRIIEATLEKFGHRVTVVENGREAVNATATEGFDLLLCDVRMPGMSGPVATQEIRKRDAGKHRLPIIALTADAMEEHVRRYLEAGMDACVTKPLERAHLLTTINGVLGEEIHIPVPAGSSLARGATAKVDRGAPSSVAVSEFLDSLQSIADEIERERKARK